MLFELLNTISVETLANQFIDYALLTGAFFSFFKLIDKIKNFKKEVKENTVSAYTS